MASKEPEKVKETKVEEEKKVVEPVKEEKKEEKLVEVKKEEKKQEKVARIEEPKPS